MTEKLELDVLGVRVEVMSDGHESFEDLYGAAALAAIEQSPRLLVHAGGVVRDGQAVIFPGASGTGKSTTVAACLLRGFGYLSDEMVALDFRSGEVEGWARPLMLTPWAMRAVGIDVMTTGGKEAVPCELLGGAAVDGMARVAHVVGLRRGASATKLEPMRAGEMLAQVLTSSFNHYRFGAQAWEAAAVLARQAQGWWLDVADVDSASDLVAGLPYSPT